MTEANRRLAKARARVVTWFVFRDGRIEGWDASNQGGMVGTLRVG